LRIREELALPQISRAARIQETIFFGLRSSKCDFSRRKKIETIYHANYLAAKRVYEGRSRERDWLAVGISLRRLED